MCSENVRRCYTEKGVVMWRVILIKMIYESGGGKEEEKKTERESR